MNSTIVGAAVKSVGASVKSVVAALKSVGAAFELVGVALNHCNKFKRYDPGLHIGSWDYEGNNANEYAIVV